MLYVVRKVYLVILKIIVWDGEKIFEINKFTAFIYGAKNFIVSESRKF